MGLVAIGWTPNTAGMALDAAGAETDALALGAIVIDGRMQTRAAGVYAAAAAPTRSTCM